MNTAMRNQLREILIGVGIGILGFMLLVVALPLTGCDEETAPPIVVQPVPSGYERTDTGSGCRETATGQYVDRAKCAVP